MLLARSVGLELCDVCGELQAVKYDLGIRQATRDRQRRETGDSGDGRLGAKTVHHHTSFRQHSVVISKSHFHNITSPLPPPIIPLHDNIPPDDHLVYIL